LGKLPEVTQPAASSWQGPETVKDEDDGEGVEATVGAGVQIEGDGVGAEVGEGVQIGGGGVGARVGADVGAAVAGAGVWA